LLVPGIKVELVTEIKAKLITGIKAEDRAEVQAEFDVVWLGSQQGHLRMTRS
jgi:hypothetical protein